MQLSLARRDLACGPFEIASGKIGTHFMTELIESRLSVLRASLVIAALCSLCVSSNVGPRFLPLPTLENYEAEQATSTTASRSHSKGWVSFRVPMAQAQKRLDQPMLVVSSPLKISAT